MAAKDQEAPRGKLEVKDLKALADAGAIDTVLGVSTDMRGRFMGKRVVPE